MRASPCLRLELPDDERVALLLEDYDFFVQDQALFCDRLAALTELRGKAVVQAWQAQVAAGEIENVVRELLLKHYDPGYASSIARNFSGYAEARKPSRRPTGPRRPWPSWRARSCGRCDVSAPPRWEREGCRLSAAAAAGGGWLPVPASSDEASPSPGPPTLRSALALSLSSFLRFLASSFCRFSYP